MNKKLIISLIVSSAFCAPFVHAMSLLPRARQVAAMVMNPSVRSAVTQASRTVTNSAVRNVSRSMPEINQSAQNSITQNVSRSFGTQGQSMLSTNVIQKGTSMRSRAVTVAKGVTGLGAIGVTGIAMASVYAQYKSDPETFFRKTCWNILCVMIHENPEYAREFADLVTEKNIMDIDPRVLVEIIKGHPEASHDPEYAREFADLVTEKNIMDIDPRVLVEIIKGYPEASHRFATYLTDDQVMIIETEHVSCMTRKSEEFTRKLSKTWPEDWHTLFITLMDSNPKTALVCEHYLASHMEKLLEEFYGLWLIKKIIKHSPESAAMCVRPVAQWIISNDHDYRLEVVSSINDERVDLQSLVTDIMQSGEQSAVLFTSCMAEKLAVIAKSSSKTEFIKKIMNIHPKSIELFAKYALKDFKEVNESFYGRDLFIAIIDKDPKAIELFTKHVIENFGLIIQQHHRSHDLIALIMDKNPTIVSAFAECAVKKLVENQYWVDFDTKHFVREAMRKNIEFAKCFAQAVSENIAMVMQHSNGLPCIREMMAENIKFAEQFSPYALQHCDALMKNDEGKSLIAVLLDKVPEVRKQFMPVAVDNMDTLIDKKIWRELIINAMTSGDDPELARVLRGQFISKIPVIAKTSKGKLVLINIAIQYPAIKDVLEKAIKECLGSSEYSEWLDLLYKITRGDLTPTELGFLYAEKAMSARKKERLKNPKIKEVVDTVIRLEKKYEPTHYTFTHGRNRAYDYVSTVYGKLHKYAYNTEVPEDFIFTHTKDAQDSLKRRVLMDEERKLHEANIKERENISGEIRNRRLFLNTQLFGNMGPRGKGSSSFSYFLKSNNASRTVKVTVKDMFAQFGQSAIYEKYKDEFEALEKEHTTLSQQGELLVVAVPKERVNQDVTVMAVSGKAAPEYMINGKKTNNVREILEARKKDPSIGDNELNFTLAMTDTAALDPKSGIKIHSVQGVDRQTYAAWQAKVDELMAKIEAEFKAGWNQKMAQARNHNQPIYDAIKPVENAAVFHRVKNLVTAQEQQQ